MVNKNFDDMMARLFRELDVEAGTDKALIIAAGLQLASIFMLGITKQKLDIKKIDGKTIGVVGLTGDQALLIFAEMAPVLANLATVSKRFIDDFVAAESSESKVMDDIKDSIDQAGDKTEGAN